MMKTKTSILPQLLATPAGLRFPRFYNSAKYEPARALLMSDWYWQDCGLGIKKGITMGQAMRGAGYATSAISTLVALAAERVTEIVRGHRARSRKGEG